MEVDKGRISEVQLSTAKDSESSRGRTDRALRMIVTTGRITGSGKDIASWRTWRANRLGDASSALQSKTHPLRLSWQKTVLHRTFSPSVRKRRHVRMIHRSIWTPEFELWSSEIEKISAQTSGGSVMVLNAMRDVNRRVTWSMARSLGQPTPTGDNEFIADGPAVDTYGQK